MILSRHQLITGVLRSLFLAAICAAGLWQYGAVMLSPAMVIGDAFSDCDAPTQTGCGMVRQIQTSADEVRLPDTTPLEDRQRVFLDPDDQHIIFTDEAIIGVFLVILGMGVIATTTGMMMHYQSASRGDQQHDDTLDDNARQDHALACDQITYT